MLEFSVSPLYLIDCVCWCLWHNSGISVLSKAEHLLWRHSKWRVWEGVLQRRAGLVGGTRSFWRGYATMGGSLGVGEPEQRTEALPRCGESQSALGCHCCSGGKGCCENSPFSFFFLFFFLREGTNQRNFFLHGSSSHAVVSVRLRVDF